MASFEETWRRRFESFGAKADDDAGIAGWSANGLATRLRAFERAFGAARLDGQTWIDVGCGAGTYSRWLAARGARVIGLDYSQPSLAKAARFPANAPIAFAVADATRLPLPAGCAHGVLLFGVLQALSSPGGALAELHRVLRPGGALWLDALNADSAAARALAARERAKGEPPRLRHDAPDELLAAVSAAGFEHAALTWVPIAPGRTAAAQPLLELAPVRGVVQGIAPLGRTLAHSLLVNARVPEARA
ncbi:MAG TPA: class I SAM-dependent methyltransferase [Burkholderiaceae bacterium]|nr:class I SAM-dependent methyltransferase [Burkholderiaceae bacterium]HRZ02657.1 class I SAM-dependent methyltransferase [Burkholderiaceae bacterium]